MRYSYKSKVYLVNWNGIAKTPAVFMSSRGMIPVSRSVPAECSRMGRSADSLCWRIGAVKELAVNYWNRLLARLMSVNSNLYIYTLKPTWSPFTRSMDFVRKAGNLLKPEFHTSKWKKIFT